MKDRDKFMQELNEHLERAERRRDFEDVKRNMEALERFKQRYGIPSKRPKREKEDK